MEPCAHITIIAQYSVVSAGVVADPTGRAQVVTVADLKDAVGAARTATVLVIARCVLAATP